MMTDIDIVRHFIDRLAAHDAEGAGRLMADDVFVHNMPIDPTRSKAAWIEQMLAFGGAGELQIELLQIVGDGKGVVLTERMDSFLRAGHRIDLPVMGAFTLQDGKIVSWREYFDMGTYQRALEAAAAAPSA
ncbi:MAG TPA: limonene-1,2-epoxide hydrolase family protein [Caulobacteraceae bacterium]|jgi:limonene-1,2-epoxide hydrolase